MAKGSIADCHWKACDTCIHGKDEGGCTVEEEVYYELDSDSDTIVCAQWTNE